MGVEVIIPAAGWDDATRVAARAWIVRWWQVRNCRVTVAGLAQEPWSKGAAVNDAISSSTADVIVVADADSFVSTKAVGRMIRKAGVVGWVTPFDRVSRLDSASTAVLLGCDPAQVERPPVKVLVQKPHNALPGGGIIAAHRDIWNTVGGFDPRFTDWGGEDYSLGVAMRTMTNAAPTIFPGDLWHLWHEPQTNVRAESGQTSALAFRYRKAKFRPDSMRQLLAEWR